MHPLVRIIDSEEFRGHLYKAARHQIFKKVETGFVVCRSTKKGVLYTETIIGDSSSISFEDWGEKIIGFGKEDWEEIEYSNYCVEQSRHKIPKLIEIGKLHFHPRMLNGEEIRYIAPSTASNIEITENFEPEVRETGTGLSLIDQKPVRKVRKQVNTGNYGRGDLALFERDASWGKANFMFMIASVYDKEATAIDVLTVQRNRRQSYPNNDSMNAIADVMEGIGGLTERLEREGKSFHEGNLEVAELLRSTRYYLAEVFTVTSESTEYTKGINRFTVA
jgi:hypothetical protein